MFDKLLCYDELSKYRFKKEFHKDQNVGSYYYVTLRSDTTTKFYVHIANDKKVRSV